MDRFLVAVSCDAFLLSSFDSDFGRRRFARRGLTRQTVILDGIRCGNGHRERFPYSVRQ